MKRYRQTLEEVISLLSPVDTTWMDDHSAAVVTTIAELPIKDGYTRDDINNLLAAEFNVGITMIRLVLGMSKDEFQLHMTEHLDGPGGSGVTRFRNENDAFLDALDTLGLRESLSGLSIVRSIGRTYSRSDCDTVAAAQSKARNAVAV